jgi:hypothetical protein
MIAVVGIRKHQLPTLHSADNGPDISRYIQAA